MCVIAVIILIYTFLIAVILLFLESWDIGSTKDVEAFFSTLRGSNKSFCEHHGDP